MKKILLLLSISLLLSCENKDIFKTWELKEIQSDKEKFKSVELMQGERIKITFKKDSTFSIKCNINRYNGKIDVKRKNIKIGMTMGTRAVETPMEMAFMQLFEGDLTYKFSKKGNLILEKQGE